MTLLRRVIDLRLFTALLGERLIASVTSATRAATRAPNSRCSSRKVVSVLKGVVQYRRSEDLGALNPALLCQHARDGEWVVNGGRSSVVFASLMTVLISGECRSS